MLEPFLGFGPGAVDWFRGLEADNSKAYFVGSRAVWEADVRGPLERLLEELGEDLGGSAKLFRPHRDVRFSKDKSPYKTNNYGVVPRAGERIGALCRDLGEGAPCRQRLLADGGGPARRVSARRRWGRRARRSTRR